MQLSDIAIQEISNLEETIKRNDFKGALRSIRDLKVREEIFIFLTEECDIPVLSYFTDIPEAMFMNSSITNIELPNTILEIQKGAFFDSQLESIKLPESLKKIGERAFHNCKNLTYLELPESVTVLENKVFEGCPDNIVIKTPKRTSHKDMLRVPKGDLNWYQDHLIFEPKGEE